MLEVNLGRMLIYSCIPKVSVAYSGAAGVPIAVPLFCSQKVLPNIKMLFSMTSLSVVKKRLVGKVGGIRWLYMVNSVRNAGMPEVELMLVYMDEASAVKILAPVGMKSVRVCPYRILAMQLHVKGV